MNQDDATSPAASTHPEPASLGALLRAEADNELSEESRRRLHDHLRANPEDEKRIEFERRLRHATRRAMATPVAPAALHQRVRAIAAEAARETTGAEAASPAEALAPRTRHRSYWARPQAWATTAAAALFAAFATILIWQGASVGLRTTDNPAAGYETFRTEVTRYVADEHDRIDRDDRARERKMSVADFTKLRDSCKDILGVADLILPVVSADDSVIYFRGAGRCGVPGSNGRSLHIRFDVAACSETDPVAVSLFIKHNTDELPLEPGVTYAMDVEACGVEHSRVLVWLRDGLVYYLVSEKGNADQCDALLDAMQIDRPTRRL